MPNKAPLAAAGFFAAALSATAQGADQKEIKTRAITQETDPKTDTTLVNVFCDAMKDNKPMTLQAKGIDKQELSKASDEFKETGVFHLPSARITLSCTND